MRFPAQTSRAVRLLGAGGLAFGCVNLEPLHYDRDFGSGPVFIDARVADLGAGGFVGPGPGRGDAASPSTDLGVDDARRPGLPDARPPAIRCPEDRDCAGLACGLDPVCRVSCGDCAPTEACQGGECVPAPPDCPEIRDCGGRDCGLDPVCGVSCGACADDEVCGDDARCRPRGPQCPQDADCGGGRCGADPVCGVDCGGCETGERCEDGVCRCAPACGDRSCGDDGCGGVCGRCAGAETCSAEGRCVCEALVCEAACCPVDARCVGARCCPSTFRAPVASTPFVGPVVDPSGRLLIGGGGFEIPLVAAFDPCDGSVAATGGPFGLDFLAGGTVFALAPVGGEVVVAGAFGDPYAASPAGFIGRLAGDTLRDLGYSGLDAGWIRAISSDGGIGAFMTGGNDGPVFSVSARPPDLRSGCLDAVAEAGEGFAAQFFGGRRWAAGTSGGQGALYGFADACLTWDAGAGAAVCGCEAALVAHLSLPDTARVVFRAMAFGPGGRFVAGFASSAADPGDARGILAFLDENGAFQTRTEWNPTVDADVFTGLAMGEGTPVYASAIRGRPTVDGPADRDATAHLLVIDPATGQVSRDVRLGAGGATGVALADGGVYVVVDGPDGTELVRCTPAGDCP